MIGLLFSLAIYSNLLVVLFKHNLRRSYVTAISIHCLARLASHQHSQNTIVPFNNHVLQWVAQPLRRDHLAINRIQIQIVRRPLSTRRRIPDNPTRVHKQMTLITQSNHYVAKRALNTYIVTAEANTPDKVALVHSVHINRAVQRARHDDVQLKGHPYARHTRRMPV